MKKVSLSVLALLLCLLALDNLLRLSPIFAQSNDFNVVAQNTDEKNPELANVIKRLTNRSFDGLKQETFPDGRISIDFEDRFQNVMLSMPDAEGNLDAACVTSLEEANAFFGRNLETGEKVSRAQFQKDDALSVAARHGMSVQEFEFYKNLIDEAARQRALYPDAATINIVNGDAAGEGFNSAAAPAVLNEGGNTGATLGQQRLNLFNFAAGIWSAYLDSSVPINVNSQFNSLTPCTTSGGVLGSAGSNSGWLNFANAPFANTIYHTALANKISGTDNNGAAAAEINATFNSDVDTGCLGAGTRFYYGLNNSTPAGTVNLLVVLLHEMGHGLGFSSYVTTLSITGATNASPIVVTTSFSHGLVNGDQVTIQNAAGNTAANGTWTVANRTATTFELAGSTGNGAYTGNGIIRGANNSGFADVWSRLMFDRTTGKYWSNMTTAERSASILNTGNLMWDGANVKNASSFLTAGRDAATGRVQMFAPNPFQSGSSVSHWDTAAFTNLLMEPVISAGLPLNLDLTRQQMRDIGWSRDTNGDLSPDTITNISTSSTSLRAGANVTITWTNNGGFNRNVIVELSTDGGATYQTTLASNYTNDGSLTVVVPNSPTTQGRIRVREDNFVAPAGASASNFTILAPSAPTVSVRGRIVAANGKGIAGAIVSLSDGAGATRTAISNAFGYYHFDDVTTGETYVFDVYSKRHNFVPRVVTVNEDMTELNFIAAP
jgi:hypothetical protein